MSVAFKSINGQYKQEKTTISSYYATKQENETEIHSHKKNTLHLFLSLDDCLFEKNKGNVLDSTVQDFIAH